jgi:hypothetical protein
MLDVQPRIRCCKRYSVPSIGMGHQVEHEDILKLQNVSYSILQARTGITLPQGLRSIYRRVDRDLGGSLSLLPTAGAS